MADQRTSQLESTEPQASAPHTRPPATIHDLPPELLDHIMSFLEIMSLLPRRSIRNLMLNRKLRSACEARLYREICLKINPDRSLQLLNTFVLRPDLALLVRSLDISLEWCSPKAQDKYKIPHLLQPDGVAALALAKNVRSLDLGHLAWVSLPSLAHIREVVSQMELNTLTIFEYYRFTDPTPDEPGEMIISNLRSTLRSQPKLEVLTLLFHPATAALFHSIEAADVPSLNRVDTDAQFARHFVNVAPKLSTIYMDIDLDATNRSIFQEQWNGNNIKELCIEMPFSEVHDWAGFGCFLGCFPNSASLMLLQGDYFGQGPALFYYDEIAPQLRPLTSLRELEIRATTKGPDDDPSPAPEVLLKFKTHCPTLERFVDTNEREWVYIPSGEGGGGFRAQRGGLVER